jgi:methionine synthase II (cobalamin-independent)
MSDFTPNCLPLLIGSVPLDNHLEAAELIFKHTPEIPIWPQLPAFKEEGMIPQFLPGFPGVDECDGKSFINAEGEEFDMAFLAFFEEYLMVTEGGADLENSRFAITSNVAKGFFEFLKLAGERTSTLQGLKGQITGPITFCTGVVDQAGRAIFYNDQLRDAAVKMLALKAQFQARKMAEIKQPSIVFFDEPGLSGFGTSAFITISKEDIINSLSEVFAAVKAEDGLTGVHVCANTEWSLLFDAGVDIVSYDAYSFFDRLVLYDAQIKEFFARGGILATGIVPTTAELIDIATVDDLVNRWFEQTAQLEAIGIPQQTVFKQTFITPSCGTGTVTKEQAVKVLELTRDVSAKIREKLA